MFDLIESPQFAADLTVASDRRTFLRGARRQDVVQSLAAAMRQCVGVELFERISDVMERAFDEAFQNPWDAAVAVYLWMLCGLNEELGKMAAIRIERSSHACWWWAREVAGEILQAKTKSIIHLPPSIPEQSHSDAQAT